VAGAEGPTDEELVAFAARLLRGADSTLTEPYDFHEMVLQARALWLLLYEATQGGNEPSSTP